MFSSVRDVSMPPLPTVSKEWTTLPHKSETNINTDATHLVNGIYGQIDLHLGKAVRVIPCHFLANRNRLIDYVICWKKVQIIGRYNGTDINWILPGSSFDDTADDSLNKKLIARKHLTFDTGHSLRYSYIHIKLRLA